MTVQLLERRLTQQEGIEESLLPRVGSIKDEIRRLTGLLEDFRTLARKEKYSFTPTCLATLCSEVTSSQEEQFRESGIRVESTFTENLPDVSVDCDKLKQAVLNLCKNAVEVMPQGGTLILRGYPSKASVILEVADTGPGVESGIDIFAPFVTTKAKGTGLGLMLTRKIVLDHGGTISYTSEPGQGTIFQISLPSNKPDE